ncbi:MAG: PAS domain-containing protein [Methanotrichaceae archaeon]|nr:PAS domain-containing protein [Methanotrichaceae archaeon]
MSLPALYYLVLLALSALASAAIAAFCWTRRSSLGTKPFIVLMVAVSFWSFCDLMRLLSSDYSTMVFWDKMSYLGIVLVGPSWLAFCLQYTKRDGQLNRRNLALLSIVPLVTLVLVFFNEQFGLIWTDLTVVDLGQFRDLAHGHGPWFWVNVAYSYLLILTGTILLFQYALRSSSLYRNQAKVLALGAAIPLISNALYVAGVSPFYPLDMTTLAFSLTGLVAAWGMFHFKLLDIVPVAYDSVVSSMADGVVITDAKNRVADINPAALKMSGLPSQEIIGRPADLLPMFKSDLLQRSSSAIESESELEYPGPNGQRFYDLRISVLYDPQGDLLGRLWVFRDITDRRRAQDELFRAHQELERRVAERTSQLAEANLSLKEQMAELKQSKKEREKLIAELEIKNSEMERFTYTVSHDLRSPLITIKGFLGFLRQDLAKGSNLRTEADMKRIEEAVDRMDLLLRDTLALSRIGRVVDPPQYVNFGEIVKEALDQVSLQIRSSKVRIIQAESYPVVFVDRLRLAEALANLIENSIKYMGHQASPEIEIGWRKLADGTAFFVRDNGMGLDPSQHQKVFELFYKVDKKSEGTGAGLAIVKRIVEVHGGRIWIESEAGKGCSVCFTLPRSDLSAPKSA